MAFFSKLIFVVNNFNIEGVLMNKAAVVVLLGMLCMMICANLTLAGEITAKGVKFGVNFSNWRGDDVDVLQKDLADITGYGFDKSSRGGIVVGGFVTYSLSSTLAIQPEVLYANRGAKFNATIQGVELESSYEIDYVDIPILVKRSFRGSENVVGKIFAGPSVGINISSNSETIAESGGYYEELQLDTDEDTNLLDYGFVAGVEADNGSGLALEVRYYMGFNSVFDLDRYSNIKNNSIAVMLSVYN
jgi:hypothetical protein